MKIKPALASVGIGLLVQSPSVLVASHTTPQAICRLVNKDRKTHGIRCGESVCV